MAYGDVGPYGEGVYGADGAAPIVPPSPPDQVVINPGHNVDCVCSSGWRFEACNIITGQVKAVLHPISINWEEKESVPGNGTLLVPAQDLRPDNLWPHTTSIYISQVINGERVGRWAGIVEDADGVAGGSVSVGLKGIDNYLNERHLADNNGGITMTFDEKAQTEIARDLANAALSVGGISMFATAGTSLFKRDRTYNSWDFKNIGEAINQLSKVINGLKYRLRHTYAAGAWKTEVLFVDTAGSDRGLKLLGGREGATYGLRVDAKDHATWAYGIGEGEELLQKVAVAYDEAGIYPRFHAVPAWKDVSEQETLNDHTAGYVANHRDPTTTPTMSIPGLDPAPEGLQLGDRVYVSFSYGFVTFNGFAKVLSIGWSIRPGAAITRSLAFQPEIRPGDGIRVQDPVNPTPTTPPSLEPTGGLVSRMTDPRITESSGITTSRDY